METLCCHVSLEKRSGGFTHTHNIASVPVMTNHFTMQLRNDDQETMTTTNTTPSSQRSWGAGSYGVTPQRTGRPYASGVT